MREDVIENLNQIKLFSVKNAQVPLLPTVLYHASLYSGLKRLDPEKGQGFGIWMQGKIKEAAHFALSRSTNPMTGQRYDGVSPTVYEMDAQFKKLAIFPDEVSLYSFSVHQNNQNLNLSYQHMRQLLVAEGFDGIFLMKEQTVSAIVPDAISIKIEHDAIPLYTDLVKPELVSRFGRDPFLAP